LFWKYYFTAQARPEVLVRRGRVGNNQGMPQKMTRWFRAVEPLPPAFGSKRRFRMFYDFFKRMFPIQ
jgi:hypothetical protein